MNPADLPPAVVRPLLLVISAPSGAGKSTLCRTLLASYPSMRYSISATTRAPRGEEQDGREYYFLTPREFERRVQAGAFLEHAQVHGHRYGTLRAPVEQALRSGHDIVMAIDVQGAAQIRSLARQSPPEDIVRQAFADVFVVPPSMAELRRRLECRAEDPPHTVARRLRTAAKEIACWGEYRYLIVNDQLEDASARLAAIVAAEHCRNLGSDECRRTSVA